jgi:hypothetical protein
MLAAKYIEMEMAINHLTGTKLEVVEKNAAVASGLIDAATARTNSVHLFRKHNLYTPHEPNYNLKTSEGKHLLFHRLADIALFAKGSQNLMISHYLAGLETFDALANPAPYQCTLRIDRNRISDEDYHKLLRVFGQLKSANAFPDVSFALKLKDVPYAGEEALKNKEWQITLSNVEELDREAMLLEVKTPEQREKLGFK